MNQDGKPRLLAKGEASRHQPAGMDSGEIPTPLLRHSGREAEVDRDPGDPLLGTRYRTIKCIGGGGMADVFLAEDLDRGEPVVVKLVRPDAEPDIGDRLRLEAEALQLLQHPNVVTVHGFGYTAQGRPYIVMERLFGRTLKEEVEARGPFPVEEAIELTCQILQGLSEAHARGLIHRDIKPDNLFVCDTPDGRIVKIFDFGLTKSLDDIEVSRKPTPLLYPTKEGHFVGSPRFMAPEQLLGKADRRADLFAVGLVLYALLAGHPPFPDVRGIKALILAHRQRTLDMTFAARHLPVPDELLDVLRKAIDKDPDARFGSAQEFRAALLTIVRRLARGPSDESSVSVRVPTAPTPASSPAPRSAGVARRQHVFEPGDVCGNYRIERLIAFGGIGEVYIAAHEWTGLRVAIKVLQPLHQQDATTRKRMEREAKLLCSLRHPNIVLVTDAGVAPGGFIFMIMELYEGETLRQVLQRVGRLSPADALRIASQISRGIAYAHELDVVHRDLKPENILIRPDGHVVVCDFGIAKWKDGGVVTDPTVSIGTPVYMSPEQLRLTLEGAAPGEIVIDHRTDLYSLGLIVHEMIVGQPVWMLNELGLNRLPDTTELRVAHLARQPSSLRTLVPSLPEPVGAAIDRALARNASDRFATMAAFGAELRRGRLACLARYPDIEVLWPEDEDLELTQARVSVDDPQKMRDRRSPIDGPERDIRATGTAPKALPPAPVHDVARPAPSARPAQDDTSELPAIARARIQIGGRLDASWRHMVVRVSREALLWALLIGVVAAFISAVWFVSVKAFHAGQARALRSREVETQAPQPPPPALAPTVASMTASSVEEQPPSTPLVSPAPSMSPVAMGSSGTPASAPARRRPPQSFNPYKVELTGKTASPAGTPRHTADGLAEEP